MLARNPAEILAAAGEAGYLNREQAELLAAARRLYTDVTQVLTTLLDAPVAPEAINEAVKKRVAAAAGLPGLPQLEAELRETREKVQAVFADVIERAP
jgi:glutamate-ammonia-ligase adenylyltransferase